MLNGEGTFVHCRLGRGLFSTECSVRLESIEGPVDFFVDDSFVRSERTLSGDEKVDGLLTVRIIAEQGNDVLVHLPTQSSPTFSRVWVPRNILRPAA